MWYIYAIGYLWSMVSARAWINLENIVLNYRSQSQRITCHDYIYIKGLQISTKKVDQHLPRARVLARNQEWIYGRKLSLGVTKMF